MERPAKDYVQCRNGGGQQHCFSCASLKSFHETQSKPIHGVQVSQMTTPTLAAFPLPCQCCFAVAFCPTLSWPLVEWTLQYIRCFLFRCASATVETLRPLDSVNLPMFQSHARMIFTLARRRSPSITLVYDDCCSMVSSTSWHFSPQMGWVRIDAVESSSTILSFVTSCDA